MLPPISEWESFYVIIGSSAAALTGLQFVVIALSSEADVSQEGSEEALNAFATPTVVHFCVVLLISAILSTPHHTARTLSTSLWIPGVAGFVYGIAVLRRARKQTGYKPVLEDWIWHTGLPFVAYAALFVSGLTVQTHPEGALHFVAATALLLLFTGIHNAWDAAVYLSVRRKPAGPR